MKSLVQQHKEKLEQQRKKGKKKNVEEDEEKKKEERIKQVCNHVIFIMDISKITTAWW